jgi:hypothetical protein
MTQEHPCVDCVRLKQDRPGQSTRYCPADDGYRCREHRTAHLARLGVGKPVPQPPATVGQQKSFL